MLSKVKKIIGIVLAICMTVTMFAGNSMMAYAAGSNKAVIDSVKIVEMPEIVLGESLDAAEVIVETPEGCIAQTMWMVWDEENQEFNSADAGSVFEQDAIYMLNVIVVAEEGYTFNEEFWPEYTDDIPVKSWGYNWEKGSITSVYIEFGSYSFMERIDKVDITIPDEENFSKDTVDVAWYSGDQSISDVGMSVSLYDYDAQEDVEYTEYGRDYSLEIYMNSNEGEESYIFDEEVEVFVNGEIYPLWISSGPTNLEVYVYYSLDLYIDSVVVSELNVEPGNEIKFPELLTELSEESGFYCSWYEWEDSNANNELDWDEITYVDLEEGTVLFEEGKAYVLSFGVYDPQVRGSDDFVFQIGSETYKPTESAYYYWDTLDASLELVYDLRDTAIENPFTDVNESDYSYDAVLWAVSEGITEGTTNTTFSPKEACTRAQVVTFLWRANGCPKATTTDNPFTDVSEDKYYYDAVLWAVEQGITKGETVTTFNPDGTCTREQVATFLWRVNGCPEPTIQENPFTDMDSDRYSYDAVLWAVEEGITEGMTDTTFGPKEECKREQVVTFLYRAH